MSMSNFPDRRQIEAAAPLNMEQARSEKTANITIEISPAGLVVKAEYTGTLSSIPAAIERLRSAGVIELVERSAPAQLPVSSAHSDAPPMCPVHGTPMKLMEKPDKGGRRWWCTKKTDDGFCKSRA